MPFLGVRVSGHGIACWRGAASNSAVHAHDGL